MNKWIKASTIAGVTLLAGALYLTDTSWAQSNPPAPSVAGQNSAPAAGPHKDRGWARVGRFSREERVTILAEALGLPVAEVQQALNQGQKPRELIQAQGFTRATFRAALSKVLDKHLQQAVADGRLTQQQAKQIRQWFARQGPADTGRGGPASGPGQRGRLGRTLAAGRAALQTERQALLAEVLGMTPEELQKALAAGQTPRELAQAQGLDETAWRAALKTAAEQRIQQALKDGRLTPAQADRIRAQLTDARSPWQWLRWWQRYTE